MLRELAPKNNRKTFVQSFSIGQNAQITFASFSRREQSDERHDYERADENRALAEHFNCNSETRSVEMRRARRASACARCSLRRANAVGRARASSRAIGYDAADRRDDDDDDAGGQQCQWRRRGRRRRFIVFINASAARTIEHFESADARRLTPLPTRRPRRLMIVSVAVGAAR